ncbi:MAG: hypothetical protein A3J85_04175 [Desulfobacula sp. RIFOXYA12_FULL_46_16]|nr:MAG: hypothetical protein A2464_00700 [Deltaproteobacteria bacterium RIFOXYC2_FULL_48_10]OGR21194.1 MAG: hypothetical protein A3J85_04175 [Desulfobacula sp. RIFOXYA12_FULL_46_16]OGR48626.1 MAG: hypothetical protein A3J80_00945 [Desulfobacula sp. RIFOXYB2_FULL_45_6]
MAEPAENKIKIPMIGLLAVKNLLITKEDLQKALSYCSGAENLALALKEYFLSKEIISAQNMERLLRAAKTIDLRQKEFKFGAVAIRKGFINQSVLKLVLEEQENDIKNKRKVRLIGDMLVEAGMMAEKQKNYILKLQERVREEVKKSSEGNATDPSSPSDALKPDPAEGLPEKSKTETDGNEQDAGNLREAEIIEGGIKLEISKDFMAAFLSKTDYFDDTVTLDAVKTALFEKGIVAGLAEDKMIEGFIRSSGFKTKSFRVAKGISPIQGKDARIEFFFNIDYLKVGDLTADGGIDFKERGEIPFVEAGTVLAEKIPLIEARKGHNIYGHEIEITPGKDIDLKCGKGAKLSEDGHKLLADVGGFPKYALSGHVFVHQEYTTEGDVDYETGHVQYDGNVNVKGRIKSGFKVEGNNIQAIEVDGGIITAEGNVKIAGGINEGKIYAKGNVHAKFIHKSEIICMGDVVVGKEIVDSDIECSGGCVIDGKLISSRISAKMGIKAKHIGTEMSGPSVIRIGQDIFTVKELEKNKAKIEHLKKMTEFHGEKKDKLKEDHLTLQKQITDLAHIQDRSQLEQKELNSKILALGNDTEAVHDLQKKIEQLQMAAKKAEESLDACFDKSDKIEAAMANEDREIEAIEKRRADLIDERNNLIKWAKENPGKPVVTCEGVIMPETLIKGKHTEKRITEMLRYSKISEVLCTSDQGKNLTIYEMQVGNI